MKAAAKVCNKIYNTGAPYYIHGCVCILYTKYIIGLLMMLNNFHSFFNFNFGEHFVKRRINHSRFGRKMGNSIAAT